MIEGERESTFETRKVHMDNLFRVVQYCENITDCRRAQLLHYFGETTFDASDCAEKADTVCDNCISGDACHMRDCTEASRRIVTGVNDAVHEGSWNFRRPLRKPPNRLTMNQFIDVFMVCDIHSLYSIVWISLNYEKFTLKLTQHNFLQCGRTLN